MSALGIFVTYLTIGMALSAWVWIRGLELGGRNGIDVAILVGVLWPFLAPVVLNSDEVPRQARRDGRVDHLARAIDQAWIRLPGTGLRSQDRAVVDSFVRRLKVAEQRELDIERASAEAPEAARESLARLRAESASEVSRGVALLEELLAQLTVLRFVDQDVSVSTERDRVEVLLHAIGVDLSTHESTVSGSGLADRTTH
ncbi:MAG: hypothetical protein HY791_39005 [Deltaproteobacteria bacterium]|nr:hypothetical protein [Deltaproteobacteria bacterium]